MQNCATLFAKIIELLLFAWQCVLYNHGNHVFLQSKSAISNLDRPYGIAFNESGKMVVSEWGIHRVCVLDKNKKVQNIKPELMKYPSGIAVHKNNIFVASKYWLLKFNFGGDLISKHNVKRNL